MSVRDGERGAASIERAEAPIELGRRRPIHSAVTLRMGSKAERATGSRSDQDEIPVEGLAPTPPAPGQVDEGCVHGSPLPIVQSSTGMARLKAERGSRRVMRAQGAGGWPIRAVIYPDP